MTDFVPRFGWNRDKTATKQVRDAMGWADFTVRAPRLKGTGVGKNVFFWTMEQQVLSKIIPSWDQGQIGSCVAHGWGRSVQDLLLAQIALTGQEMWPGFEVCREAIYAGSRIEIGHSPGGEGSVGAWAAQWVVLFGILFYTKYGAVDLTGGYDVTRCRQWGDAGLAPDLEAATKLHAVKTAAPVTTPSQAADAIANFYPVAICGEGSRTMKRNPGGWCPKIGNDWPHCQELRGCCVVKGGASSPWGRDGAAPYSGDVPALVYQNSWADYLGSDNNQVSCADGSTATLPQGCYLSTYDETTADLAEGDSFAPSHANGFPAQTIPWIFK